MIEPANKISNGANDFSENNTSPNLNYWRLLWRQMIALINLSIRRYLFTRYMWVLILLGIVPVFVSTLYFINVNFRDYKSIMPPDELNKTFQIIFRTVYIHFIIFFIANIFGFSLLRKEVDDQTLHYLFLQPVSKIRIIISKYLAFLMVTWLYLTITFFLTYIIFCLPYGIEGITKELFVKGRAISLLKQCFVMLVALAIYGSVSMIMGSLFKSGSYGALFYLWETGVPYLPSTLKYFTISFYIQTITPEKSAIPPRLFELYGPMPSLLQCWITLTIIILVSIGITVIIMRSYECKYSEA